MDFKKYYDSKGWNLNNNPKLIVPISRKISLKKIQKKLDKIEHLMPVNRSLERIHHHNNLSPNLSMLGPTNFV